KTSIDAAKILLKLKKYFINMGSIYLIEDEETPPDKADKINLVVEIYTFNTTAYSSWAWENNKCAADLWTSEYRKRFWSEETTRFLLLLMRLQLDNSDKLVLWVR